MYDNECLKDDDQTSNQNKPHAVQFGQSAKWSSCIRNSFIVFTILFTASTVFSFYRADEEHKLVKRTQRITEWCKKPIVMETQISTKYAIDNDSAKVIYTDTVSHDITDELDDHDIKMIAEIHEDMIKDNKEEKIFYVAVTYNTNPAGFSKVSNEFKVINNSGEIKGFNEAEAFYKELVSAYRALGWFSLFLALFSASLAYKTRNFRRKKEKQY